MRKDTRSMEFRTDDDEVCRQASESMESNRAWIVTEVQVSYGLTPQLHRVRLSEIYVAGESLTSRPDSVIMDQLRPLTSEQLAVIMDQLRPLTSEQLDRWALSVGVVPLHRETDEHLRARILEQMTTM